MAVYTSEVEFIGAVVFSGNVTTTFWLKGLAGEVIGTPTGPKPKSLMLSFWKERLFV